MTAEEKHKKITQKGRRWLSEFICETAEGCISTKESRTMVSRTICAEFRNRMDHDKAFYSAVESFCDGAPRRTHAEKQIFCSHLLTEMIAGGNIHRKLAAKYPDKYTLPKQYSPASELKRSAS